MVAHQRPKSADSSTSSKQVLCTNVCITDSIHLYNDAGCECCQQYPSLPGQQRNCPALVLPEASQQQSDIELAVGLTSRFSVHLTWNCNFYLAVLQPFPIRNQCQQCSKVTMPYKIKYVACTLIRMLTLYGCNVLSLAECTTSLARSSCHPDVRTQAHLLPDTKLSQPYITRIRLPIHLSTGLTACWIPCTRYTTHLLLSPLSGE